MFPGNVNGVNVIGLALQGPSVPSIAMLRAGQEPLHGPYTLQPRTGNPPRIYHILLLHLNMKDVFKIYF